MTEDKAGKPSDTSVSANGAVRAAVIGAAATVVAALIGLVAVLTSSSDGESAKGTRQEVAQDNLAPTQGTGTTRPPTAVSSPTAAAPQDPDRIRWTGSIRLTYVNLDSVPPKLLDSNTKASIWIDGDRDSNGNRKLHGLNGGFFTTLPTVAAWQGTIVPTRRQCADLIATQGAETTVVANDSRFCVKSAEDRVAYLAITKFDKSSGDYFADVTVWDEPAS